MLRDDVLVIVLAGGAGERLAPLTRERAKPAVYFGGPYRIIDFVLSNCINSGLRHVFIATQYKSLSLNRHIRQGWTVVSEELGEFIEILPPQKRVGEHWYQGTADAVYQNLYSIIRENPKYVVVLAGDHVYKMDYQKMLRFHIDMEAEVTLAAIEVPIEDGKRFGIVAVDETERVNGFLEKPQSPPPMPGQPGLALASMGIYVFNREALISSLDNDLVDFGKNIIPSAIQNRKVMAHIFEGYWEDIGTIRSFFDANLEMADNNPKFSFYVPGSPVYSQPLCLPATVIDGGKVNRAMVSDGCILGNVTLDRCVIGIRSIVRTGSTLRNTVMMGADLYESLDEVRPEGVPPIGVGTNCSIEGAIIDKNARIGNGVVITPKHESENFDGDGYYIRDGIVVVPKNSVIPDGTRV